MAQQLAAIPNGSDLLIDANVFIYGLTSSSAQCKDLLERCSNEEIFGVTLFEVLHEATHHFMIAEGKQKGLFTRQGAGYLASHPDQVRRLAEYWVNTQRLLALNLLFLPMEPHIVDRAQLERLNAGLLTNDSLIVAAMKEYGVSRIATNDRHFETVAGITVFAPTDIL